MTILRKTLVKILLLSLLFNSFISCAEEIVFVSEEYGFKITFSETWAENKVFLQFIEGNNYTKTPTFYVALPTEDPNWYSIVEQGYAFIFAVSAYTEERWNALSKDEDAMMFIGTEIGRNNKYIFASSHAHASPSDLMAVFFNTDYTIEFFDVD